MEAIDIYKEYQKIVTAAIRLREQLQAEERNPLVEEIDGFLKHRIEKPSEDMPEVEKFEEVANCWWDGDKVVYDYSGECPHCNNMNYWSSRDLDREEIPCCYCTLGFKPGRINITTALERRELLRPLPNCVQP
jgi:hypothetical protein